MECRLYKSLVMVKHGVSVGQVTRDGYTRSVGWTSHSLMIVIHGVSVGQGTRDGYTWSVGWTSPRESGLMVLYSVGCTYWYLM